jgi:uncharacterized protein with HEPN domain
MSERDPWVRVRHMRDYATEALELAEGRVREDLQTDRILRYALVHLVELVGEAAAHVDEAIRERAPGIPWSRIVSTRNRLIHGYDYIDYETLWDVLVRELPALKVELDRLLCREQ